MVILPSHQHAGKDHYEVEEPADTEQVPHNYPWTSKPQDQHQDQQQQSLIRTQQPVYQAGCSNDHERHDSQVGCFPKSTPGMRYPSTQTQNQNQSQNQSETRNSGPYQGATDTWNNCGIVNNGIPSPNAAMPSVTNGHEGTAEGLASLRPASFTNCGVQGVGQVLNGSKVVECPESKKSKKSHEVHILRLCGPIP